MSTLVQNAIEKQVEDILTQKGIFDYSLCFTKKKIFIKINQDKTAKACFAKFTSSQSINNDPRWIKCLTCKIDKVLHTCFCVWVICIDDKYSYNDINFENTNVITKEIYTPVLNGFSCYGTDENIQKLVNQNTNKIIVCDKDKVASINANNRKQTVGQFIYRLGTNKSSRRAGTQKPLFPIPNNIFSFVIDTGILKTHPDLQAKISQQYSINFSTSNKSNWNDDNGHGTHVAGIIGALDNKIGIVGNAPNSNLVAVKVLNRNGSGSTSNVISGINYVAQWKRNNPSLKAVVNMSLGSLADTAFDAAVKRLVNNFNVTVVVAAGNSSANAINFSPSRVPEVITVGAYNGLTNNLTTFSNYGEIVDILAPGLDIDSCYLKNSYAFLSGTSMASPMVAGAVVDILANPSFSNYTPSQIRDKLIADAKVLSPICNDGTIGSNPIINLSNAAKAANTTDRSVYIGTY